MAFATYVQATRCTDGPTPGAKALMAWALDEYDEYGVRSDGIFNCREVRGGGAYSLHAEGRADDIGFPLVKGKANPAGTKLVHRLRGPASKLGIQCIIWNRTIWSAKSDGLEGRPYLGVDPHVGHLHVELTRRSAEVLNLATLRHHLPDPAAPAARKPGKSIQHGPVNRQPFDHRSKPGVRILRRGFAGDDVKFVQRAIGEKKCGQPDGLYDDKTVQGVRWYQTMRGLKVDGITGSATWKHLMSMNG